LSNWGLTAEQQRTADARCHALGGYPKWLPNHMMIFQRTGTLKAIDWKNLIEFGAIDYVMYGLIEGKNLEAFDAYVTMLQSLMRHTLDVRTGDDLRLAEARKLKLDTIERLCAFERYFPATEHATVFHICMHVPDCIYRWGSVRNFWAFFNERLTLFDFEQNKHAREILTHRYLGWLKHFIHSRSHPLTSLVKGYSIVTLMRILPVKFRRDCMDRIQEHGVK